MTDPSGTEPTKQEQEKPDGLEDLEPSDDPKGGRRGVKLPDVTGAGGSTTPLYGCCTQGCNICDDLGGIATPIITGIKY